MVALQIKVLEDGGIILEEINLIIEVPTGVDFIDWYLPFGWQVVCYPYLNYAQSYDMNLRAFMFLIFM